MTQNLFYVTKLVLCHITDFMSYITIMFSYIFTNQFFYDKQLVKLFNLKSKVIKSSNCSFTSLADKLTIILSFANRIQNHKANS